ncbi:MAG: hypothetical protein AAF351_03185 [Pseudomonadota bacterium]
MSVGDKFPPNAFKLATSEWYFDFSNHRCPHDGWLNSVTIFEDATGDREAERRVGIETVLLGPYHDLLLTFRYQNVSNYSISGCDLDRSGGHYNWRYDEFRLSEEGLLVHEIEWASILEHGRWLIECEDVAYTDSHYSRAD